MKRVEINVWDAVVGNADEDEAALKKELLKIRMPGYSFHVMRVNLKDGGAIFLAAPVKHRTSDPVAKKHQNLRGYHVMVRPDLPHTLANLMYEQIRALESHEVAELFRYEGQRVYQPHVKPGRLARFVSKLRMNRRDYVHE